MSKSPDAFRTISEVADWLGVQAHVLRFWESKFTQVKPVKRAGGRRYYRPADMLLLGGLRQLLHEDGLTIKGAQKLLREKGVAHVAQLSRPLDDLTMADIEDAPVADASEADAPVADTSETTAQPVAPPVAENAPPDTSGQTVADERASEIAVDAGAGASVTPPDAAAEDTPAAEPGDHLPQEEPETETGAPVTASEAVPGPDPQHEAPDALPVAETDVSETQKEASQDTDAASELPVDDTPRHEPPQAAAEGDLPDFLTQPLTPANADNPQDKLPADADTEAPAAETPAQQGTQDTQDAEDTAPLFTPPEPAEPVVRRPANVDVPIVPDEADIDVQASALSAIAQIRRLDRDHADSLRPLLKQLIQMRNDMAGPGKENGKD